MSGPEDPNYKPSGKVQIMYKPHDADGNPIVGPLLLQYFKVDEDTYLMKS